MTKLFFSPCANPVFPKRELRAQVAFRNKGCALLFLLIFLFFLSSLLWRGSGGEAFSQQSAIDSLSLLLKTDKEDTSKVNHLNALGWELMYSNPDTSIILGGQALFLAQKSEWKKGIASSLGNLGVYNHLKADYPKALDYYLNALKLDDVILSEAKNLSEKQTAQTGIANRLGNIGIVYRNQADYPKALDYYLRALKINEELGRKSGIAIQLSNIGILYGNQGDYHNALDYYLRALKIDEGLGNKNGIAATLGNIGNVYGSRAVSAGRNPGKGRSDSLYNKALDYYFRALKMDEELGDKNGIAADLGNIGSLYTAMMESGSTREKMALADKAEKYLSDALKMNKEIGLLKYEMDVENYFTNLYTKTNRHQLALEHYKKAMALKDTIFSEEKNKEITRKEMNYEFEKKEAATQAETEKEKAVALAESRRQWLFLWLVAAVAVAVAVIAVIIFRSLRVTQRQKGVIEKQKKLVDEKNILVEVQKKHIEEKHKEVTDSINYAKRIQSAILAKEEDIKKVFPDIFLLYKPKDIVAGDFYFFETTATHIFYGACDCTGHGVPGALVSIVCSNALSRCVKEFQLTNPAEILNKARELVLDTFSKSGEEIKDGMDISLLSLELGVITADNAQSAVSDTPLPTKIQWSGANNPLWYFQNGELKEITASKQPIGYIDNPKPFTAHNIELSPLPSRGSGGGLFFLFTDGYADQFGGSKGKKFKYKQLEELLLSIHDKSMSEQKVILEETIENWKGDLEQVDDICVIGVRV